MAAIDHLFSGFIETGTQYPIALPKAFLAGKITWTEALRILTA